jgi:hypothetical protein
LIATYLVLKIALQAVLQECNRLAALAEASDLASSIKARIASLEIEFASGAIDSETYERRASEILDELNLVSGGMQLGGTDEL